MDFTGLRPLKDKLTSALSKGMKQRVALGRTLLHDPKLLILDEPADGLDPRARIELRELLRALADQGKAVLISSHILTELSEICDTCAIIEQGRLLATGKVAEHPRAGHRDGGRRSWWLRLFAGRGGARRRWARAERLLLEQPRVTQVAREGDALRVRLELRRAARPPASWVDEVGGAAAGGAGGGGRARVRLQPPRARPRGRLHDT